jgi:hypothetical protein
MTTKPVLFWPKPRSDIAVQLGRAAEDFSVVDTNSGYELQKLYKIKRVTPIFDPFPGRGAHYRDFRDHVVASGCRIHIVGMDACRRLLQVLDDPSLADSSLEELLAAALIPAGGQAVSGGVSPLAIIKQSATVSVDWSRLTVLNTLLAASLVFVAALIGHALASDSAWLAAAIAAVGFTALYVAVRSHLPGWFLPAAGRTERRSAAPGL